MPSKRLHTAKSLGREPPQRSHREGETPGKLGRPHRHPDRPLEKFDPAEDDHPDDFANNPNQGYCQFVVKKKVEHFKEALEKKGEKPTE